MEKLDIFVQPSNWSKGPDFLVFLKSSDFSVSNSPDAAAAWWLTLDNIYICHTLP